MKWIFLLARGVVGALGELTNLCNSSHWSVVFSLARNSPEKVKLTAIILDVLSK